MTEISGQKKDNEAILCPYCEQEITELIEKKVSGGMITDKCMYASGNCKKVLPVSHSTYAF